MLVQPLRTASAPSAEVAATDIGTQRVNRAVVFVIARFTARWFCTLRHGRHGARRHQSRTRLMRHYLHLAVGSTLLTPTSLSGRVSMRPAA